MQELVAPDKEPITPFIARIRLLFESLGISTILVIGGAGDYFEVADDVVMMDCYKPHNVTERCVLRGTLPQEPEANIWHRFYHRRHFPALFSKTTRTFLYSAGTENRAKEISARHPGDHIKMDNMNTDMFKLLSMRYPKKKSVIDIRNGGKGKVTARTLDKVEFGGIDIELDGVAQLVEKAQTRAIGDAIAHGAEKYVTTT